jgi:hypothetical protein
MHTLRVLVLVACAAAAAPAFADSCDSGFEKKGNPLVGTRYIASVSLPGLTVESAIGQLRGIAIEKKMDVLSEDAAGGSMLLEERESMAHKPIPVVISARREGDASRVEMTVKLNPGAFSSGDSMKKEMCGMLDRLKPGAAGEQLAAKGRSANAGAEIMEFDAFMLGAQFERQGQESPAALDARFKGKTLRIKGRAQSGAVTAADGTQRLAFDIADPGNRYNHRQLICIMARDQAAYAMSVREGERMTLTGTFMKYEIAGPEFWLQDCRSSN